MKLSTYTGRRPAHRRTVNHVLARRKTFNLCQRLRFIHDQVKGTGRNSVFRLSHRLAAAWSRIWSKRAPKGLHFGPNCPLYSIENKGTPGLDRRLLTEGLLRCSARALSFAAFCVTLHRELSLSLEPKVLKMR